MSSSRIAVRKSVVLPEPFGPRTATTSAGPNRASTPCRIWVCPIAAVTPRNSSRGAASAGAGLWTAGSSTTRAVGLGGGVRGPPGHDLERQPDGGRIGDIEEAVDRSEIAGRPSSRYSTRSGASAERLLDPMLDDDDRGSLVGQCAQERQQAFGRGRIQVGERLVDDEQPRPHHEDGGHRQELPLAARQGRGLAPEQGSIPAWLGDLADPVRDLVAWHAEVLGPERQLRLDHRADDLLGRVLEHGADGPRDVAQLELGRRAGPRRARCRRGRPGRRAGSGR